MCVCVSKCWKEACLYIYIYTTVLCICIYIYIRILSPSVVVTSHFASKVLRPQLPLACYRSISLGRWFPPTPNHRSSFHQGSCWCWSNLSAKECQEKVRNWLHKCPKKDETWWIWYRLMKKWTETDENCPLLAVNPSQKSQVPKGRAAPFQHCILWRWWAGGCIWVSKNGKYINKWIKMALYHTLSYCQCETMWKIMINHD